MKLDLGNAVGDQPIVIDMAKVGPLWRAPLQRQQSRWLLGCFIEPIRGLAALEGGLVSRIFWAIPPDDPAWPGLREEHRAFA